MDRYSIVKELGENKVIEKIVRHYKTVQKADLCQYLYLYLLVNIEEDKLIELYKTNKLNKYIAGQIHLQVLSTHSYHYKHNVRTLGHSNTFSIENQSSAETPYAEALKSNEDIPHQLEDSVDRILDKMPPLYKDILLIVTTSNETKKEDIDIICKRYHISYRKYQKILPVVKDFFKKQTIYL